MAKPYLHAEAVRLRVDERLSLGEIRQKIPVSKAALSLWIKPYPLTQDEMSQRRSRNAPDPAFTRKNQGEESANHRLARTLGIKQTTAWKGHVAEAAVLYRLVLWGFEPLQAVFEGDSVDWFVRLPSEKIIRLQVKWAARGRYGLPLIQLTKSGRKYKPGQLDFFVGYDLFTDIAYVWSWDEVQCKLRTIAISPDAAERWDKLQGVV